MNIFTQISQIDKDGDGNPGVWSSGLILFTLFHPKQKVLKGFIASSPTTTTKSYLNSLKTVSSKWRSSGLEEGRAKFRAMLGYIHIGPGDQS